VSLQEQDSRDRVLLLGAGLGGSALLEMLQQGRWVEVVGVVDTNPQAPGLQLASELGIPTFSDVEKGVRASMPCMVFNLTGDETLEKKIADITGPHGVTGGVVAKLIWEMVTRIRQSQDNLLHEATHDPLTDLYNRRYLMDQLQAGVKQASRYATPYSIAMIDLDHFKQVNDTHGHLAGDQVLRHVSHCLSGCIRGTDILGRYGGEEFLVLLPQTDIADAARATNQWLERMVSMPADIDEVGCCDVSFSAGVACFLGQGQPVDVDKTVQALLTDADNRLYRAKQAGRACVVAPAS
jgi:diguanylate cyclase (GGDEF)-like protein